MKVVKWGEAVMEEAEMEVVVAEEVGVVYGEGGERGEVTIVAEFAEAEVAAVKVEVSTLPAEVRGGEGGWGDVMVVALIRGVDGAGRWHTVWWWWWLQGGESGAGDRGELMMEGDGSGREECVGAATGRWVQKTRKAGALAEVKVRVGGMMVMVTVLQEGPLE